jgi:hypothetical protein
MKNENIERIKKQWSKGCITAEEFAVKVSTELPPDCTGKQELQEAIYDANILFKNAILDATYTYEASTKKAASMANQILIWIYGYPDNEEINDSVQQETAKNQSPIKRSTKCTLENMQNH